MDRGMGAVTFFIIRGAEVVKNFLSSLVDLTALPAMDLGGGGTSGLRAICALLFEGCGATTGLRATRVLVLGVFFCDGLYFGSGGAIYNDSSYHRQRVCDASLRASLRASRYEAPAS